TPTHTNTTSHTTPAAASTKDATTSPAPRSSNLGTVSDGFSGMSTSGITSSNHDVKLTAGNDLTIGQAITLGTGNLTLVDTGNVRPGERGIDMQSRVHLVGGRSVHKDNSAHNITT